MASERSNWTLPAEAPASDDLSRCVHCGLCLNSCPTFAITGLEAESPRGRIALARAVESGDLLLTAPVQEHWDLCLQCRACEAVCPSNVPYGRIMEHIRVQVAADPPAGGFARRVRRFALRRIVADGRVLALFLAPARLYGRSKGRRWLERSGLLRRLPMVGRLLLQLPTTIARPVRPGTRLVQPASPSGRALLFTGCVMGELFGSVHRATARLLSRRDIACVALEGQSCCGALHAHDGDIEFARELARSNIEAFEASAPDPIVVNSAGCGAAMKEYGDLLSQDPVFAERARSFARRVVDLSEFLAGQNAVPAADDSRVSYQHACHLAHAQRIREAPLSLVDSVQGATRVQSTGDDLCCGAAGIYSLVQPGMSAELRTRKSGIFRETAPDVVVTANPGCQMQYQLAVAESRLPAQVLHLAEFLDRAERTAAGNAATLTD